MKATVTELRTRKLMDQYTTFNDCDRDVIRALSEIVRSKRYPAEVVAYIFAKHMIESLDHIPLKSSTRNALVIWMLKKLIRAWVKHWQIVRVWKQIQERRQKGCVELKKDLK